MDSSYVPLRAGITETLMKLDEEKLTVTPWLAESFEGEDGQNWTIHIREGVTIPMIMPLIVHQSLRICLSWKSRSMILSPWTVLGKRWCTSGTTPAVLYLDLGRTGGGNNSGFESLLYLNGRPFQGVDSNHHPSSLSRPILIQPPSEGA